MRWFKNLKIAPRLLLAFSTILCLVIVLGLFSIIQLKKLDQASNEVTGKWAPSVSSILKIKYSLTRYRTYELQHAISNTDGDFDKYENSMQNEMNDINRLMADYKHLLVSKNEMRIYGELLQSLSSYEIAAKKVGVFARSGDLPAARDVIRGDSRKYNFLSADLINELVKINEDGSAQADALVNSTYESARSLIIGLIFSCIALGILLAIFIARSIALPLRQAVDIANRVAAGDLTADIKVSTSDETGELFGALRLMNENLRTIVGKVRHGTDTIAAATNEIASSNLDLSSRTEEQAASLEETAATMQELTATVKQNTGNAKEAHQLASTTSITAKKGGKMMEDVVTAISDIQNSSLKIAEIISVIDGIAFQTNLLALNASVEAARAGEQGRGFAVVAAEVRNLAQRSASAAKEIKHLIEKSAGQVHTGTALVSNASTTIGEIVRQVQQVSTLVGEISIASAEQSQGIEQINVAMTQMDQVTQQNAALVEEAAAASAALQQQADDLTRTVSNFKLSAPTLPTQTTLVRSTLSTTARLPLLEIMPN